MAWHVRLEQEHEFHRPNVVFTNAVFCTALLAHILTVPSALLSSRGLVALAVVTIQRLLPRICQPGVHFKSVRFENKAVKSSFEPTPPVEIKNGSMHWKTYWLLLSCCEQCRNPSSNFSVAVGPLPSKRRPGPVSPVIIVGCLYGMVVTKHSPVDASSGIFQLLCCY